MILAGDIGGTHTRLALFEEKGELKSKKKHTFDSSAYKGLAQIVQEFLKGRKGKVKKACFGIAGPVRDGKCQATNLPWVVDVKNLKRILKISRVHLLNDLEANAYGLRVLKPKDFFVLNRGKKQQGNQALISAGTGLGEAGLYWDGKEHKPFASEGGHADFSPQNQLEIELLLYLKEKLSHVSCERVISGPGLHSIYNFLVEKKGLKTPAALQQEIKEKDPSSVISEWGRLEKDPGCTQAVDRLISAYGSEAGNLALKFLALGGVYVGGGIAPHLAERMKKGGFFSAFVAKGRLNTLLETIPIRIVLNDQAALLGAAEYARMAR